MNIKPTGSWVRGEILDHAPLHYGDSPAAKDNSICRNDPWNNRKTHVNKEKRHRKKVCWGDDDKFKCECVYYQSLFSVLLWGCSRSRPPWTSAGWAVAGSPTADSTSHASTPCPGSPGHITARTSEYMHAAFVLLKVDGHRQSCPFCRLCASPVTVSLHLHLLQTGLWTSGSHIARLLQRQRSSL